MVYKYPSLPEKFISFGYVEDSIRGRIVEWINRIIEEEKLPFDRADAQIEIKYPDGSKRKFPDIVIWKERLRKAVCLIELKTPSRSPLDWYLINDAQSKAYTASPQIPYFATWNINELVLWKTFEEEAISWEERRKSIYPIAKIKDLREIDYPEVEARIKESIRKFLKDLVEIYIEKKILPTIPIDEFFIYSLRTIVDSLYFPITLEIKKLFSTDQKFRKELVEWFVSQGWNAPSTDEDFEKIARQFLYLLMNKVMFYNTLRKIKNIKALQIPEDVESSEILKQKLQEFFEIAKEATRDYETIFGLDFLEKIPIPNNVVSSLISFINGFSKYDFSKIGYKDLGHIFDRLIPDDERHKLGQYYTNPDVVDIINSFCIRSPDDKIADFGCGAGTFLVRAYARIKYLNLNKPHAQILDQLVGNDISKFAAHLSMINLAIRDLNNIENYPLILCKDFFDILPSKSAKWPKTSKETIETLSGEKIKVEFPQELDVVVGNPPYTRQEELEAYVENYKEKLQNALKQDWGEKIKLGKRAGIYAYFFLHGLAFLKNRGRFGYITSNSWLDVDYGKYLQEFFLKHCKIIAIIEPKERVFPDADINTVITILERCENEKERNNNFVKFVKLKVSLKDLIPQDEKKRFEFLNNFVERIEKVAGLYEDENMRIFPKLQSELWKEGYDDEIREYVGSKWGKYLRAPHIYFKILLTTKFENLSDVLSRFNSKLELGIATGANKLLFISSTSAMEIGLENGFLKEAIESPRDCDSILIEKTNKKVIFIKEVNKRVEKTRVWKYLKELEMKERANFQVLKKPNWFLFQPASGNLAMPRILFKRIYVLYNPNNFLLSKQFVICKLPKKVAQIMCAILNSTISWLIMETEGRKTLGLGSLNLELTDWKKLHIIDVMKIPREKIRKLLKAFKGIMREPVGSVFEELGANFPEEISFDKIKPNRRNLDNIIMGEILGLTKEEQLEVYKAVIQLVKERIEKAKSVEKIKKAKGADPEALAEGILREIDTSKLKRFPDEYISDYEYEIRKVPEGFPEIGSDLKGFFVKIDEKRISCSSSEEAKWIYYAVLNGVTSIKIPKNKKAMKDILKEYTSTFKKIENEIKNKLEGYIPDRKLREKVKNIIYKKIFTK
jgi:chorismate mutase